MPVAAAWAGFVPGPFPRPDQKEGLHAPPFLTPPASPPAPAHQKMMKGLKIDLNSNLVSVRLQDGVLEADGIVYQDPSMAEVNNVTRKKPMVLVWESHFHSEGGQDYHFIPSGKVPDEEDSEMLFISYPEFGSAWDALVSKDECTKQTKGPIRKGDTIQHKWKMNNKCYTAKVIEIGIPEGSIHANYTGEYSHTVFDRWLLPSQINVHTIVTNVHTIVPMSEAVVAYIKHAGLEVGITYV